MMDRLESFDNDELMQFVKEPRIQMLGIGGAGNNILTRLYRRGLEGVQTVAINTDAMHLNECQAHHKLVLGADSTRGRGAGGNPGVGRMAAEADHERIAKILDDNDLTFVIAGMGGGTGTGAAPVIARQARQAGQLVVGVAIMPFEAEGDGKRAAGVDGMRDFKAACNSLIELDNENLNKLAPDYPIKRAFGVMSDLVVDIVQELAQIVTEPSTINVDFADLKRIIEAGGIAKVLYGESDNSAPGSVLDAVLGNPLLDTRYKGAEAMLLHVTAGSDFSLNNCHEVLAALKFDLSEDVNLIWGLRTDDQLGNRVKVVLLVSAIPNSEEDLDIERFNEAIASPLGDAIPMVG